MALIAEAVLVLVVLTLGSSLAPGGTGNQATTLVHLRAIEPQAQSTAAAKSPQVRQPLRQPEQRPSSPTAQPTTEVTPAPVQPRPSQLPTMIQLSPKELAAADIATLPRNAVPAAPSRSTMGPPDTGSASHDTPRVGGSGPHGEPLYAASWYREPYDDELKGYLSTASGPGWGLIACRTAPHYRVEDCVKLDEYPEGSNIARSVLAAAWQFQVRPPRIGGEDKIGEWVRIRIDYGVRPGR